MESETLESSPKDSKESTQAFKPPFKPSEEVIIQERDNINSLKQDESFKGKIESYESGAKQNSALEELKKGNTQVPNLLRKINKSTELKENKQREIESYFNEDLDENQ